MYQDEVLRIVGLVWEGRASAGWRTLSDGFAIQGLIRRQGKLLDNGLNPLVHRRITLVPCSNKTRQDKTSVIWVVHREV